MCTLVRETRSWWGKWQFVLVEQKLKNWKRRNAAMGPQSRMGRCSVLSQSRLKHVESNVHLQTHTVLQPWSHVVELIYNHLLWKSYRWLKTGLFHLPFIVHYSTTYQWIIYCNLFLKGYIKAAIIVLFILAMDHKTTYMWNVSLIMANPQRIITLFCRSPLLYRVL